jgi:aryl-alcohol dehydrogenase-like predicted oxidoreductase
MLTLSAARLAVAFVPFHRWRRTLGWTHRQNRRNRHEPALETGRHVAAVVERAAQRLPFETKCLPRAVAVSWLLRRGGVPHTVVFAARPREMRQSADALHAWVEIEGRKVMGELAGPWLETLRLGD